MVFILFYRRFYDMLSLTVYVCFRTRNVFLDLQLVTRSGILIILRSYNFFGVLIVPRFQAELKHRLTSAFYRILHYPL